jgi:hypothetical protein
VLGFLGVLGCCRGEGGADVGVSVIGAGFGGGRPTNPNRSPQTGSSSPLDGDGGGCDGLGMAHSSGDAHYSAARPRGIAAFPRSTV